MACSVNLWVFHRWNWYFYSIGSCLIHKNLLFSLFLSRSQEDYEYSADAAVIYENVDDANFGTPHSNADGPIESTQTKNVIECIMCDEELPNQEALDEHLRNVSSTSTFNLFDGIIKISMNSIQFNPIRYTTRWWITDVHIVWPHFSIIMICWSILTLTVERNALSVNFVRNGLSYQENLMDIHVENTPLYNESIVSIVAK